MKVSLPLAFTKETAENYAMKELITMVQSPAFWVGGVILAFVINLLSNYATRLLDRYWIIRSERAKAKKADEERKMAEEAEEIHGDLALLILRAVRSLQEILACILCLCILTLLLVYLMGPSNGYRFYVSTLLITALMVVLMTFINRFDRGRSIVFMALKKRQERIGTEK